MQNHLNCPHQLSQLKYALEPYPGRNKPNLHSNCSAILAMDTIVDNDTEMRLLIESIFSAHYDTMMDESV